MTSIRMPAVSGLFYPSEAETLKFEVDAYLHEAAKRSVVCSPPFPKVLIVPHAGYIYSGVYAAMAYSLLRASLVSRVVLLGPSHKVPLQSIALSSAETFRTPLGDVPTDKADFNKLLLLPNVEVNDQAHIHEHSLEVQLPFLQQVLGVFNLLPIVVGLVAPSNVAKFIDQVWGGDETLIVVSSDLSHYHQYEEALRLDRDTSDKIIGLDTDIQGDQACGCHVINGLLWTAKKRGLKVQPLVVANSGDTAGDRERVVGYGSYAIG